MTDRTIEGISGIVPGSAVAGALAARETIMALSQASADAILDPHDPGGLGYAERAALAARMARWNDDSALAARYDAKLLARGGSAALGAIARGEPAPNDPRLAALVRHADLVTREPPEATRADIERLKSAGLTEPDIVRLAELIALVNYQVRVAAGLRLIGAAS